ncbi:hypothetical protein BD770DRAFT_192778 [Pilaira anomala]|nr:hypothetical protein BD770DRAFT_192778 [Pilaira anomala]
MHYQVNPPVVSYKSQTPPNAVVQASHFNTVSSYEGPPRRQYVPEHVYYSHPPSTSEQIYYTQSPASNQVYYNQPVASEQVYYQSHEEVQEEESKNYHGRLN